MALIVFSGLKMRRIEYPCLIYLARYVREVVEVLLQNYYYKRGPFFAITPHGANRTD